MSARDRLTSVNIAPGSIVKTAYFNLSTASSMEYNIDDENQRRSEHSIVDFVVTIPTFYDDDFEFGYAAADALKVSRNSGDTSKIDINAGVAYIGGRRYKQINDNVAYDLTGSSDEAYYIRMKYTLSTNTFVFMVEDVAGGETADSGTVKYLTLASATWNQTSGYWENDFSDLRATNTSLPPPITFAGTSASPILTIEQEGTGLGLKVVGNATGGDVQFFDATNTRKIDIYGDGSDALTIRNAALYSVTLTADNSNRLLVSNDIKATAGYFGSAPIILSGTTIQDFQTLEFKTNATVSGSGVTSIGFTSMDFTSVGDIGAASLDATGNVQGSILISDIAIGTAPLTVTSTTVVSNLNVDRVDGYHFTGASGSVSASAAELNNLDGYTGDLADLNRIIESGRSQGEVLYASAASTLAWLASGEGYLNNASGVISWDSSPEFTGATVSGATGITWDNATTDVVVTSTDGELYFGDGTLIADKETSPDWSITGAGAADFATIDAPAITAATTLSVTSGPSLTSAGIATAKALSGVTTISGTGAWSTSSTIDFSGILSGATKAELNSAADATGRLKGDLRYASADTTLGWLGVGSAGQVLKVTSGAPAWEDFGTYDNYSSWTYKLDGGDQDAVGSAQTLEFVSGDAISIADSGTRQMTFNLASHAHTSASTGGDYAWADITGGITSDAANAATTTAISADWAYDHAVGQTENLHTKVGTLTSGALSTGFTAIANAQLASFGTNAQLDQDARSTVTPTFVGLTLTGAIATPTTISASGNITTSGGYMDCNYMRLDTTAVATAGKVVIGKGTGATAVKMMEPSGRSFEIDMLSSTYTVLSTSATNLQISNPLYMSGHLTMASTRDIKFTGTGSEVGSISTYPADLWAGRLWYKTGGLGTFDHLDDLAIIDSIVPTKKKNKDGIPLADLSGMPNEIINESGFTKTGSMQMLIVGGMKQLHEKVRNQEEMIAALMDQIEEIKKELENAS